MSLATRGAFPFLYSSSLLEPVKETLDAELTSMALLEPLTVMSVSSPPSMWLLEPLMMTLVVPAGIVRCWLDSSTVRAPELSCAAGAEGAEDGAAGAWVAEASPEPAGAEAAGAEAAGADAAGAWVAEESAGAALFWVQPVRASGPGWPRRRWRRGGGWT